MPTADKWAHLYDNYDIDTIDADVATRWSALTTAEEEVGRFEDQWFRPLMLRALFSGDNGAVGYLLEAGVPLSSVPGCGVTCAWIAYAVDGNNWHLARLVRRHGAAMNSLAGQRILMATERAAQEPGATPGSLMRELREFPDNQLACKPTLSLLNAHQIGKHEVRTSWPPTGSFECEPPSPPEHATALPPSTVELVRELWRRIGVLRRAEAKVLSAYNWAKMRRAMRVRAIAIFWQGVTQEAKCAPNGTGRAADLMAYRAEFGVAA